MIIRSATLADAEAITEIYRPYVENTAITFEYTAPSVEEFKIRIRTIQNNYPFLVAESDGNVVGYAYLHAYRERYAYHLTAEVSIYLKEDTRGKGVGSALLNALEEKAKDMNLALLVSVIVTPEEENDPYVTDASIRFHKKMGYTSIGVLPHCGEKFSRWYGTNIMVKKL